MKILPLLLVAALAAPALAETGARPYVPAGGTMVVGLDDDSGQLQAWLAQAKRPGLIQCFREADGVEVSEGAADVVLVGCYLGVRRDGSLVAPPLHGKRASLAHLLPELDGSLALEEKHDRLEIMIGGQAANAIGMWTDCSRPHKVLACLEDHGMAGKLSWSIGFALTKSGGVRALAQP